MMLKFRRNPFNADPIYEVLEPLAEQQEPFSEEERAIEIGSDAILFIYAPPTPFVDAAGELLVGIKELLIHLEKSHVYVAALGPWVEEVKKRATDEQMQFLQKIGLHGVQVKDEFSDHWIGDDTPDAPEGDTPAEEEIEAALEEDLDPAEALSILETLTRRRDPRTVLHLCLDLAVQTLQFLTETGQLDAFRAFLAKLEKSDDPTEDADCLALH